MAGQDQLGFDLARMNRRIEVLENRTFTIPVVDADPPSDNPISLWQFADGRLRGRLPDGSIVQYTPNDTIVAFINAKMKTSIPTLSGTPTNVDAWVDTTTGVLQIRTANGTIRSYNPVAQGTSGTSTGTTDPGTGGSSGTLKPTPPPPPQTRDKTWDAAWAACYAGNGNFRTDSGNLYYGFASRSVWGNQKVMIGLNNLQADLAGSVIKEAYLTIESLHTWNNSGANAMFGTHVQQNRPAMFSRRSTGNFKQLLPKGKTVRFRIPNAILEDVRDNKIEGVTIDQPSNSTSYYGYISSQVRVQAIYVK